MSGTAEIRLDYIPLVETVANLPLPTWDGGVRQTALQAIQQALTEIGYLRRTHQLTDQILTSPYSIALDAGIENGYIYHSSIMLHVAQLSSHPGEPLSLRIGHSFVKTYFGLSGGVSERVEYPTLRSQVLFFNTENPVNRIVSGQLTEEETHLQGNNTAPTGIHAPPVIEAIEIDSPAPTLQLPEDNELEDQEREGPMVGPVSVQANEGIGSVRFQRLLERIEAIRREREGRVLNERDGDWMEGDERRQNIGQGDGPFNDGTIDPGLLMAEISEPPFHRLVDSYNSTPAPNNSREASVLLLECAPASMQREPVATREGFLENRSVGQREEEGTHSSDDRQAAAFVMARGEYASVDLRDQYGRQAAFIPSLAAPEVLSAGDDQPQFVRRGSFVEVASTGEVVARLDEAPSSFPDAGYLSDIAHTHPVTFFELADQTVVGYSPNMVPNIPIFPFIPGASYLPALAHATIAVVVFWRRRIQRLVLRVKKNFEEREEEASEEEIIEKDSEVQRELKHPCVIHLLDTPGSHSDFASLLVHPRDWSPLFTVEEGAFFRTTIDYFRLVGRWDFAEALHTLLGLHFADDDIIRWLVNSNLADPQRSTHQDLYDNSFRRAEAKVHALILREDPWYAYPGENSSEVSEID
ncbi:hypothetical protein HETIRDRAFT_106277 [Heterobasidion irregulare TC 32-1]|uniref:Uncharacterized protein n=1 Tax=Heterobasidion irregulare (strain TC 32-1) TaxID=747525 RepID=W4JTX5_HETIT|nr:uncharacterized protein HETIRDRAFT_106277 [Heterobasidion irregulare TC 32-1]ETW76904.1 hypothetical protein HETIRDRAFT_106277 [Heterobasidion irregulare TC 32-1]